MLLGLKAQIRVSQEGRGELAEETIKRARRRLGRWQVVSGEGQSPPGAMSRSFIIEGHLKGRVRGHSADGGWGVLSSKLRGSTEEKLQGEKVAGGPVWRMSAGWPHKIVVNE